MSRGVSAGVGGAWKDVPAIYAGVGGAWKSVAAVYAGVGGVWKQVFPRYDPLSAVASPSSQSWTGSPGSWMTGTDMSVVASGGDGNYTYAWSIVSDPSGNAVIGSPTSQSTGAQLNDIPKVTVTFKCTVSDGYGTPPADSNVISVDP